MKNFQNDYAITRNAIASILEEQPSDTTGKLKASLKSLLRISKQKDSLNAVEQTSIREIIQFHVNQIKSKDQLDYQGLRQYQTELKKLFNQSHGKGDPKLTTRLPDIHSQTTTAVAGPSSSMQQTMLHSAQSSLNVVLRTLENAIPMYKELSELLDGADKCNSSIRTRNTLVKSSSQMAQSCATTIAAVGFHVTKLRDELNMLHNTDTGKKCLPDESVRNLAKLLHEQMDQASPLYTQVQTLASEPVQSLKVDQIYASGETLLHQVNSKLDLLLAHNKLTPAVSSTEKRSTKRKLKSPLQSRSTPVTKKERRSSPLKQSRPKTPMKSSKPTSPSKQTKGSLKARRQKGLILPSLKAAKIKP